MARDAGPAMQQRLIDALARRAASAEGEAHRLFEERLAALRAEGEGRADAAEGADAAEAGRTAKAADALASATGPATAATTAKTEPAGLASLLSALRDASDGAISAYPALPVLDEFRRTWTRVRSDSQMRQAVAHQPENAGPLNSAALVQRSIAVMRELSPGYLQAFLSYIDDLAWLERLPAGPSGPASDAPLPATIGKRPRKPRARRG